MGGISRKIKRNIAKDAAAKKGLKANKQYTNRETNEHKSGVKIVFEKLFGKGE